MFVLFQHLQSPLLFLPPSIYLLKSILKIKIQKCQVLFCVVNPETTIPIITYSTILHNPGAGKTEHNSILNFMFTIPLKLFSPRRPKKTLVPNLGKLFFFNLYLLQNLLSPLNTFSSFHILFFPDYPPSSLSIFFGGSSLSVYT